MVKVTKAELAQAARKALNTARVTTCPEFRQFMLHRARVITNELRTRIYREKLSRLVRAFPKSITYYN